MKKILVSAPGKLMLFGEHAVVYGYPCIVTSVNKRVYLEAELTKDNYINYLIGDPVTFIDKINIRKMDRVPPREIEYIETAIKFFYMQYSITSGINIRTYSDFSSDLGLGSSSAVTICTIFALGILFNIKLNPQQIFDLAYKVVHEIKGVGSGYDLASAIYGGTIYFAEKGRTIKKIDIGNMPLNVMYTGIKADTATIVKNVKLTYDKYPDILEQIFNLMKKIVNRSFKAIVNKEWETVGEYMNIYQGLLDSILVNNTYTSRLVHKVREYGALGSKISGAGMGDCIIYLSDNKNVKKILKNIPKEYGVDVKVNFSVEGIRVEKNI